MSELYIGVMSGTSLDGVDVTLCEIDESNCKLISSLEFPFDAELKEEILNVINSSTTLEQIGTLDNKLGHLFADAINTFLQKQNIDAKSIDAIGLHGQTLWHKPNGDNPFSMQLGCPNVVNAQTNIKVVADFRRMDIANGGQGAPFAPAFHQFIFKEKESAVLNIGGMANITILGENLRGWDTGCGNVLMDMWIQKCKNIPFDKDGKFAKSGSIDANLLDAMIRDIYFTKLPPKSTGREYFNDTWLANYLPIFQTLKDEDIQRTLLELTALSIANDVKNNSIKSLIVCGGGVKNAFLMQRLQELCKVKVASTDEVGVSSEFMESMAFAWLAYKRIHNQEVNLSCVTGAKKDSILGGIYG
ncbi:anhydro-N-acetylmuramic acid kinase [Sulfurimonas sp.]|uniref:anhydro-N-acetylmuramic acid kinase n=1 Tax=Sulfurimonas sp. TaxID=2022749 RepID=UPI002AB01F98|nr:anhydro-N-acetylmuramic acid kinase [Sulfurimonas sp.]